MYGISQNPDTKDYIMIFEYEKGVNYKIRCEKCGKRYLKHKHANIEWCEPCQINYFKRNFTTWTSGNENIDDFIQEMQLKINSYDSTVFEWISYNQFDNLKEKGKDDFATVYSAIWKSGPLRYNENKKKLMRESNEKVALKCLHDSQNITNEFLSEV